MGTVSVWQEGFCGWMEVTVAQQCECIYCHRTAHLIMFKMANFMLPVFNTFKNEYKNLRISVERLI